MINTSVQEMVDRVKESLRIASYFPNKYGYDHYESTGHMTPLIFVEMSIAFAERFVKENKENP